MDDLKKLDYEYYEKLWIDIQEFIHKLEFFFGEIDDERMERTKMSKIRIKENHVDICN